MKRARIELVEKLPIADLRRVSALLESVGMRARDPAALRRAIAGSHAVAVARDEDAIVGFGRLIGDGVYYGSLWDIAVDPQRQGLGIGRDIVARLMRVARDADLYMVGLFTAMHNRRFYEHLGFEMLMDVHPMKRTRKEKK